ncbi:hypothetical protein L1049_000192 [Liquidambar formosana]|uniref:Pentatricopeptide repeat-containing protein n=1 Tax=Liquidambar formosana TaxID=63359 RepID=A0AAP0N8C5_LIQFO
MDSVKLSVLRSLTEYQGSMAVEFKSFADFGGQRRLSVSERREMEFNGFSPSIVTYNSLISASARDGLLEEAMELKTQMVEKGIKPDVFTYTTLLSGFEKAGKDESAMKVFE